MDLSDVHHQAENLHVNLSHKEEKTIFFNIVLYWKLQQSVNRSFKWRNSDWYLSNTIFCSLEESFTDTQQVTQEQPEHCI